MTLLEQQIRGLTEDLTAVVSKLSGKVTPKSVHRLRTTIRRIDSLVSYANPGLGRKLERSLEKLEDLRKRAGKVRNIDVQRRLLKQVANGSTAKDRKILFALLDKKRERQASRLSSALVKLAGTKFSSRMERIAERVGIGPSSESRPLAPLEEARLQLAGMAEDFPFQQSLKPNRLHAARIQLKKIRYLAELADESPERIEFLDELKVVQDAVGEWHDWEELSKLAEKRFADRVNCALLLEVRALFAARESAATSAVSRLFAATTARKPPRSAQYSRSLARSA
ncbi:MAG TPA: CHAD domain-containing protein [Candidatus Sulfotelmatobacter sp.]|nr:CHAD domain-containing protein [Candidatus Sulfotelmatobacter sp.]